MAAKQVSARRCACGGGLADEVHAAGVAVEAVADHGDVDVDDVAGLQALIVRDAVADDVIDRGADGLGEAAVVEVGRHRALHVHDVVVAEPVELLGGHARDDVLADHVEHLGRQAPGDAHFFLLFRGLDRDVHRVRNGAGAAAARGAAARVRHCSDEVFMV